MALSSKRLFYRRGGQTYPCSLFTDPADVGSNGLGVRAGGVTLYASLVSTTNPWASHLRCRKNTTTYAVRWQTSGATLRYSFTSAGTYYITRSRSTITIWSSAGASLSTLDGSLLAPSWVILVTVVGGGGGGGGGQGGVTSGNKSGSGGGGGAKLIAYVEIPETTTYTSGLKVVVGGGGGASAGGSGTAGGSSYVQYPGAEAIIAGGGSPGGYAAAGGLGGAITIPAATANYGSLVAQAGGDGGARSTAGDTCPAITYDGTPDAWSVTIPEGAGGTYQTESGGGPGGGGGSEGKGGRGLVDTNGESGTAPGGGGGGGDDRGLFSSDTRGGYGAVGVVRIYF